MAPALLDDPQARGTIDDDLARIRGTAPRTVAEPGSGDTIDAAFPFARHRRSSIDDDLAKLRAPAPPAPTPAARPSFTPLPGMPSTPVGPRLRQSFTAALTGVNDRTTPSPAAEATAVTGSANVPHPDVIRPTPDPGALARAGAAARGMVSGRTGENPVPLVGTAAGMVTAPFEAGGHLLRGLYRELNARDDADMQAAEREAVGGGLAAGTTLLAGPGEQALQEVLAPAAGDALAAAMARPAIGAAVGETYTPDDPDVGVLLGLAAGGAGAAHPAFAGAIEERPPARGEPIHMGEFQDVLSGPVETQEQAIARRQATEAAIGRRATGGRPPAPASDEVDEGDFRDASWRSSPDVSRAPAAPAAALPPIEQSLASIRGGTPPLAAAGAEERFGGVGLPAAARDAVRTATSQAFTNPYAPIAKAHPALSDALQSAGAMTAGKAESFGRQLGQRVVKDLAPEQAEQFERARVATNLEVEAQRKTAGAKATAQQAIDHRMEVRQLAKRDLDAARAHADQVTQQGQAAAAAYDAANRPADAPGDLDLPPAVRASRQRDVAVHAQRVQEILDGAKAGADEILKPAQQDYALAIQKGDEGHDALQTEAAAKQHAAERAKAEAALVRQRVRPGVEQEPWFQETLAKHQQMVEPFGEAAAVKAGVDPKALRRTAVGYARLTPQETINEQLLQRTQETAAAGKRTTPRTGLAKKIFGQRPSVNPLLPAGAEAPLQGPVNTLKPEPSNVATPTAATRTTGSAKEFRGITSEGTEEDAEGEKITRSQGYSTDYVTNVARDLSDKVSKMAKNQVYQALAGESMTAGSKIRKLTPAENPAPGEKLLAFNDQKDIIQPPAKDDPNYQTVQRFAVPEDVADAFARYQSREGPLSNAGKAGQKAGQFIMRSVLSNPLVAAGHTLTEASTVSRGLPAGQPRAVQALTGLPGIKAVDAIRRAAAVDLEAPETTARLHRLALSGSLRIGDERGQGWVAAAHSALFGPNGVDTRMRLVASADAEAAWKKAGGSLKDPAFTAFERDYVTGHSGNYVGKNQGTAIQALNKTGATPFIAIGRAKLGGSLKAITGGGGPPGEGIGARLLRAQRGPLGQAAAVAGAGYLLSGHANTENAPGHEGDLATGVYHLKDGSYRYFRGAPDDATRALGQGAKEVYLRKGFMDPASAAALRLLEPVAYAKPGDRVSESVRAAANTALAFVGPAPSLGVQLATGHELYLDRDGALGSVQGIHLSKDADLTDRLIGAARNMNAGVAIGMAPATPGGRSAANAFLGNLNPFTEARAGTAPRSADDRRQVRSVLDDAKKKIYAAPDPAAKKAALDDAVQQFRRAGVENDPQVRKGERDLKRAVPRSSRPPRPQQPLRRTAP